VFLSPAEIPLMVAATTPFRSGNGMSIRSLSGVKSIKELNAWKH
jgi:hypothetical protein